MVSDPRVVLIEVEPARTTDTQVLLAAAGYELVATLAMDRQLEQRLLQYRADLVVMSASHVDEALLNDIKALHQASHAPLVLLTAESRDERVKQAVEAGASAYVVDGAEPSRLRPIFSAAMARHQQLENLTSELNQTRLQLTERKLIERAKGIIMAERGATEDQAYRMMRKTAMDRNKRLIDIAESIVAASELLGSKMMQGEMSAKRMHQN